MQVLKKVDPQSICESLLNLDSKIMYSSYLDTSGSIAGEAIKASIVNYDKLTITYLPMFSGGESIVLATETNSDLATIMGRTKDLLAGYCSPV
jgi:hypothetical protein